MRMRVLLATGLAAALLAPAPAQAADSVTVVAVGDIAYKSTGAQGRTARLTRALAPSVVLLPGDVTYGRKVAGVWRATSKTDFKRKFIKRSWGALLSAYPSRVWAVPGNHEYGNGRRASGYRYLVKRYSLPKQTTGDFSGDLWWSRTISVGTGQWLVLGLDSERLSDTAKYDRERLFIQQTLAAHDGTPTIVMWHRPRYSRGEHGNQTDAGVKMLWETATADTDVRLAIWGHDHDYEQRSRTGLGGQQVTTIVTGTGGAELRGCPGYSNPTRNSDKDNALYCGTSQPGFRNYGAVELTLRQGSFAWKYRMVSTTSSTGTVVASGSRVL